MENLEKEIVRTAEESITKAIVESLTQYNGPLRKLCEKVIADNESTIYNLINSEFSQLLGGAAFKKELKSVLNHKLANLIIQKTGGELEKRVNELRADPTTRAKMTVAIEKIIQEFNK